MEAARSDRIQSCGLGAAGAMERLGLKKRVDAALLKQDINTSYLSVEISEEGVVEIHGVVRTTENKESIPEIVKGVSGVSRVVANIAVVQGHY